MGQRTDSKAEPNGRMGLRIVLIVGLVTVGLAILLAGPAVVSGADAATDNQTKVDVVVVFDKSNSSGNDRYHMARDINGLEGMFDDADLDVQYAVLTYDTEVYTEQTLTADFGEFESALHFSIDGNIENASNALLAVEDLDTREEAETVILLVTDEDDDGTDAERSDALDMLSEYHFIAVSPATAVVSSCDNHSPPCDDRTDNELRTMADDVGGDWIDVHDESQSIIDQIGDSVVSTFAPQETVSSSSSPARAHFDTIDLSANRTTVEVDTPIWFNKTVENSGSADGIYDAYLAQNGTILDERSVEISAGSTRTISFVHSFETPGTYEVLISHETVGTVEVIPPRPPSVNTTITADGTGVTGTVADASVNGSVSVPTANVELVPRSVGSVDTVTVSIGDVNVTPTHDVEFDFDLRRHDAPPNGVEPLPEHVNETTYFTVNTSLDEDQRAVSFDYTSNSTATTVYRYDENTSEWLPLQASQVNETDATQWRTNASDGSVFAIGVRQPSITATAVELPWSTSNTGEVVPVRVLVTNDGLAAGVYNTSLTVDGTPVDTGEITVPANETRALVFRYVPEEPGEYSLGVTGGPAATLQVEAVTTTTQTTTTTEETTETTTTTDDTPEQVDEAAGLTMPGMSQLPLVLVPIVLGLLLLAFVISRRR